ncbi:hypothetical protein [Bosea vaviloviae]|uniref:Uncharacterized protein n=1 Tax=Bosea vaviloviae TaxID=1526658 RepID=A0A0N1F4S6_9HYPH|nr:hypothetical protein [Bosea vaviloviae]KPH79333.1 hypothetical protein AE618_18705 [Bosea vaviloviae]
MAAKRGGKRPGAGRTKGLLNRATKEHKATLSDLARTHTAVALKALVTVATKGESESARVSAANALLDRAYGKPRQSIEHMGEGGGPIQTQGVVLDPERLKAMTDDELAALEKALGRLQRGDSDGAGRDDGPVSADAYSGTLDGDEE